MILDRKRLLLLHGTNLHTFNEMKWNAFIYLTKMLWVPKWPVLLWDTQYYLVIAVTVVGAGDEWGNGCADGRWRKGCLLMSRMSGSRLSGRGDKKKRWVQKKERSFEAAKYFAGVFFGEERLICLSVRLSFSLSLSLLLLLLEISFFFFQSAFPMKVKFKLHRWPDQSWATPEQPDRSVTSFREPNRYMLVLEPKCYEPTSITGYIRCDYFIVTHFSFYHWSKFYLMNFYP